MSLVDYGIAGGVIMALFGYLYFISKGHSAERKDWKDTTVQQFSAMNEERKETSKILTTQSMLMQDLKDLLREKK